jgi:hypothetical protein
MDAVTAAWDEEAFVTLLGKLVGEAKHLQNGAASTPTEDRGALAAALLSAAGAVACERERERRQRERGSEERSTALVASLSCTFAAACALLLQRA